LPAPDWGTEKEHWKVPREVDRAEQITPEPGHSIWVGELARNPEPWILIEEPTDPDWDERVRDGVTE
jgi:hypothetical protein